MTIFYKDVFRHFVFDRCTLACVCALHCCFTNFLVWSTSLRDLGVAIEQYIFFFFWLYADS